jgi:hypothetical protein
MSTTADDTFVTTHSDASGHRRLDSMTTAGLLRRTSVPASARPDNPAHRTDPSGARCCVDRRLPAEIGLGCAGTR